MTAPARSPEQRAEALAAALAARQERARLRAALKSRAVSGLDVLEGSDTNALWAALRVSWLLESLPGLGATRAERLMEEFSIAPSRRLKGLGEHQRAALMGFLAAREGAPA